MLERRYDPGQLYRYVMYGRMSDPRQNKRSPDQQFDTIIEKILRLGYSWQCVDRYRDDGISGRYLKKRLGLQRMLRDIEAGLIVIDLIVVDTLERLGRADEIAELRRKLFVDYGILIVAADNAFADPTGVVGKAVGMVEQIRSTENTRISRHNVIRGKKDTARLKRWPGGPQPFGYRLKPVIDESVSPPDVYSVLETDPRPAAAQRLAFERAAETGEGDQRMARWWNTSPEVPEEYKPISPFTMGYRLSSRIYLGELVWGANRTGVVNDARVIEPNPDGAEVIPNFCTPIVSAELFERVRQLRDARSAQIKGRRRGADADSPAKLIAPQTRGLTLKYLLTGLARCGSCKASMRPVPSGRQSKAGKKYVYYACPRHYDGACDNARHVPEDRLREAAVDRLRARLFPPPGREGQTPAWFPELLHMIQEEMKRYEADEPDRAAADAQELKDLDRQLTGWALTLGDPQLPAVVRTDITTNYERVKNRRLQLEQSIAAARALELHTGRTLDPGKVIGQLRELADVLAGHNPTLGNLELSRHIERIDCFPDGRVEMRGTFLGLFDGAVELLSRDDVVPAEGPETTAPNRFESVVPRRRGRLRVPNLSADTTAASGGVDTALDPERFTGLPEPFFWSETIVIERTASWAEANAAEVVRLRAGGLTIERIAAHFGKTPPTIRSALRIGIAAQPQQVLPKKIPRGCWAQEHADEVMSLKRQGMSTDELATHFTKSDTTIRAALKHAEETSAVRRHSVPAVDADKAQDDIEVL